MHGVNADPKSVQSALNAYYNIQDRMIQDRATKDETDKTSARDELRDEMGKDFSRHLTAAYDLLQSAPEGIMDALEGARLADGTRLNNNAQVLRWFAKMAMEMNPAATVAPGKGAGSLQSVESEIATIEKRMKEDRNGYMSDNAAQARYIQLVEAKDKMTKR